MNLDLYNNIDKSEIKELDLSNKNLTDISFIRDFEQLEKLNLSGNEINDISPLFSLKYLNSLDISFCNFNDLPCFPIGLKIKYINLSSNYIENLDFIQNLFELEILIVSRNSMFVRDNENGYSLDIKGIINLQKLKEIDFSGTPVTDISPIFSLKQLENWDTYYMGSNIKSSKFLSTFEKKALLKSEHRKHLLTKFHNFLIDKLKEFIPHELINRRLMLSELYNPEFNENYLREQKVKPELIIDIKFYNFISSDDIPEILKFLLKKRFSFKFQHKTNSYKLGLYDTLILNSDLFKYISYCGIADYKSKYYYYFVKSILCFEHFDINGALENLAKHLKINRNDEVAFELLKTIKSTYFHEKYSELDVSEYMEYEQELTKLLNQDCALVEIIEKKYDEIFYQYLIFLKVTNSPNADKIYQFLEHYILKTKITDDKSLHIYKYINFAIYLKPDNNQILYEYIKIKESIGDIIGLNDEINKFSLSNKADNYENLQNLKLKYMKVNLIFEQKNKLQYFIIGLYNSLIDRFFP